MLTDTLFSIADFDLTSPDLRANPYPLYAQLRQQAPLVRTKLPMMGDSWLVTRYDDVLSVLKDPKLAHDQRNVSDAPDIMDKWYLPRVFKTMQRSMILSDDPDHKRLRNLVHQAFTPRMIEQMQDRMVELVDQLLDTAAQKTTVDLIADFALPLPLMIISDMMGVPERDRLKFHKWSADFLEVVNLNPLRIVGRLPSAWRMHRFFEELVALRRAEPQDDLITALVQAREGDDTLSEEELISMIFLLLLAGHETTVNLIGNGMLALLENRDQLHLLFDQPSLIDSAVEELLRFTNPVELPTPRYVRDEFVLYGQVLRRGETLLPVIASANRDETVFENADQLDITRRPNRHLAFGLGIHYCLGAPLARLEGRIAIDKLVQRFPNLQLAVSPEQIKWRPTLNVRGLHSLPVVLNP